MALTVHYNAREYAFPDGESCHEKEGHLYVVDGARPVAAVLAVFAPGTWHYAVKDGTVQLKGSKSVRLPPSPEHPRGYIDIDPREV